MKRRRPWLAALASLFVPPLGHIYAGRPGRGAIAYAAYVVFGTGLLFLMLRATSPASLMLLVGALGCGTVALAMDALRVARRAGRDYRLQWFNRWYVYVLALVALTAGTDHLRSLVRREVIRGFEIPSGAMIPTLLIGDHILANKRVYRVGDPKRLEIAVFEDPEDATKILVERIVALPGDTIEIRDKAVWLNGARVDEPYAVVSGAKVPAADDYGSLTVPPGHYFVLGDNRDHSYDSRAFGAIPRERIQGRAQVIYWSWVTGASGDWGVRWERIGTPVR